MYKIIHAELEKLSMTPSIINEKLCGFTHHTFKFSREPQPQSSKLLIKGTIHSMIVRCYINM